MDPLSTQIISGIAVSIISFGFGYFLFRSQTNEQIRLEIYKKRLKSYEDIVCFLDELDSFSHGSFIDEEEMNKFIKKAFELEARTRIYISPNIYEYIMQIPDSINSLPESLASLEEIDENIHHLIEKDTGRHLTNWRVDYIKNSKNGKNFDAHFSQEN